MTNVSGWPLYTSAQSKLLDSLVTQRHGTPGYTLMQRAGKAVLGMVQEYWPDAGTVAMVCGVGNNGGDGYVAASLAMAAGMKVKVLQVGDPQKLRGDGLTAANDWRSLGGTVQAFEAGLLDDVDLIVDGMLGTGADRRVEGEWADAIRAINHCPASVLAVDVPSGLNADTGIPLGTCIQAQRTISFISRKQGLYTGHGPDYCGEPAFDDLDVPDEVFSEIEVSAMLLKRAPLGHLQGPRSRSAHKGDFGHVLVVGGDAGMAGAVRLAGEAAARVGAGLVSIATRESHGPFVAAQRPELMCHGVESAQQLKPLLDKATVVVVGPGLGRSDWAMELLGAALDSRLPLVVDADGLNLLAAGSDTPGKGNWVLTPHPGEAARLLGCEAKSVQSDRFAAVNELLTRYGGVCVLKGAGTLIASADQPVAVSTVGNPGMASGGMGDVLAGVIGGLIAQGLSLSSAAQAGVYVHGAAADLAAQAGERGLLARDVITQLRSVMNA